jgi:hypothetical protein
MRETPLRILVGVLLIALGMLLFEVCLTRIFSVTLWYHFGFLAIALAMLGATAAAVCCFLFRTRLAGAAHESYLGWFAALFAIAAPLAVYVHLQSRLDLYAIGGTAFCVALASQLLLLFAVFFASGMCITIAITRYAGSLNVVYFYDLVGAALGALLFLPLLNWFSGPTLVLAASVAGAAASCLFVAGRQGWSAKAAAATLTALSLALFVLNDQQRFLQVSKVKAYRGKRIQSQEPAKVFEKWTPVARVAVFEPRIVGSGREMMQVTNDGGAPTNLHRFDGNIAGLQYLRRDMRQVAHHLKDDAEVLIIGPAGGRDVRAALAFGQAKITAVEINPATVELVKDRYADYIGRIFEHPRVTLHECEGRNFLTRTSECYDLIQLSMIDSWAGSTAGAYVFNESNLYTIDAIADYMRHLRSDGVLSITRYYESHEALRLVNVILAHLERENVPDAHMRIAVVLETGPGSGQRANVLLKNGQFTEEDAQRLVAAVRKAPHALVYAPHVEAGEMLDTPYAREFRALLRPQQHGYRDREEFVRNFRHDVSAVSDDRPFFFFMDRLGDSLTLNSPGPAARRTALPLLYGAFLFLGVMCLATILAPLLLARQARLPEMPSRFRALAYFGCLGVGFMVIELALIHRLTVFLGYPTYSFIIVVTTLLLSSGIGSWLSARGAIHRNRWALRGILGAVSLATALLALSFRQLDALRFLPDVLRAGVVVAALSPLGLMMGMCFPLGMHLLRKLHEGIVPWGWAVNGAFGVLGCALTLIVALHFGLTVCLLLGGACYLAALACISTIKLKTASIQ